MRRYFRGGDVTGEMVSEIPVQIYLVRMRRKPPPSRRNPIVGHLQIGGSVAATIGHR